MDIYIYIYTHIHIPCPQLTPIKLLPSDDANFEHPRRLPVLVFFQKMAALFAGESDTIQRNRRAFGPWLFRPRVLRDVSDVGGRSWLASVWWLYSGG